MPHKVDNIYAKPATKIGNTNPMQHESVNAEYSKHPCNRCRSQQTIKETDAKSTEYQRDHWNVQQEPTRSRSNRPAIDVVNGESNKNQRERHHVNQAWMANPRILTEIDTTPPTGSASKGESNNINETDAKSPKRQRNKRRNKKAWYQHPIHQLWTESTANLTR